MGAIRGVLLVFVCVFLFLSLLIGNVFWTLNLSLDYNNVKPEMSAIFDGTFEDQNLETVVEDNFEIMKSHCQTGNEYMFNYDNSGYIFTLPCTVVLEGSDAVVNYIVNDFVEEFYYKDYDCDFIDCFEKVGPFFLVSQKAKNYWSHNAYLFLISSLILVVLLFLLTEKKLNTFIITGVLLIIASLPFAKLDLIFSFFSDKLVLGLLTIFFTESYTIFVISLVLGIILLGIGILLKIFKVGFKISNICSKFSKKKEKISEDTTKHIVKKEISKKKKVKPEKKLQIPKILIKKKKEKSK